MPASAGKIINRKETIALEKSEIKEEMDKKDSISYSSDIPTRQISSEKILSAKGFPLAIIRLRWITHR